MEENSMCKIGSLPILKPMLFNEERIVLSTNGAATV
jgi:hypothetical protein